MIDIRNVTYESFFKVDDMTIRSGELTVCIGSSGSGKTTLLKLIVKLIEQDSGTIAYQGKDIREIDTVRLRRRIAFLPQKAYLFPGTISDNLNVGLTYHGIEKDERDLSDVLARVELKKRLDEPAKHLSGGEAQRLALARVLLLDPEVFLLDEPSSALDPESERVMMDVLKDVNEKQNKTILMVTHRYEIAKEYAHRIVSIGGDSRDDRT